MAHHTRVRADLAAWALASAVPPADFFKLDDQLFKSINGDEGGAYAPSSPIVIGGQGLQLTGPLLASGAFATSVGAQNFVQKSPSDFEQPIRAMFHNGTHYVAVGGPTAATGGIDYHVTRSSDGLSWATVVIPSPGDAEGEAYCIDGTTGLMVVGIEASSSDNNNTIWSSDGGATWTEDNAGIDTGTASTIWGIRYFAPAALWIAGGDGDLYTNTSANIISGTAWTSRTVAAGLNNRQLDLIAYRTSSPLCVIATTEASEADVMTSPDGITWTGRTLGSAMTARGLIYSEYWGRWFIVGLSGAMRYSSDGTTWTANNFGTSNDLLGIAAIGPLLMILVGPAASAKTIWSLDGGATWYVGASLALGTNPKLVAIDGRFMIFDEARTYPGLRVGGVAESVAYT